ncbi:unnamed protein product [Trichobilharzia regenti]|nr:unnamed protein product [Trichobilharzia regenti]
MRKFLKLQEKKRPQKTSANDMKNIRGMHNMSDKILTENEISLLQKGLNFNITRKPLLVQEVAPMIERALQQFTNEESQSVCQKI